MVKLIKFNGIGYEEDDKFVKCRVGWRGNFCDVELLQAHFTLLVHVTRDCIVPIDSKPYELNPE
jgi:hypothetical protein